MVFEVVLYEKVMNNAFCAAFCKVSEGLCEAAVIRVLSREAWDAELLSLENFCFSS